MKTRLIAAVSAVVAAVSAVTLIATLAMAGVLPPGYKPGNPPKPPAVQPAVKKPYPLACSKQQANVTVAQNNYNAQLRVFEKDLRLWARGAMSEAGVMAAQQKLDELAKALIEAEYAQALCWNNKTKPPNKCLGLDLQKNETAALLQQDQDLMYLAYIALQQGKVLLSRKVITEEQYLNDYVRPYNNAVAIVNGDEGQIKELEQEMTEAGCNAKPTPKPTPTPTHTSPTPTPSPSTTTTTPVP
jgi:hypothetical protein